MTNSKERENIIDWTGGVLIVFIIGIITLGIVKYIQDQETLRLKMNLEFRATQCINQNENA